MMTTILDLKKATYPNLCFKKLASPLITNFRLVTITRVLRTGSRGLHLSVFSIKCQFVVLPSTFHQ